MDRKVVPGGGGEKTRGRNGILTIRHVISMFFFIGIERTQMMILAMNTVVDIGVSGTWDI